MDPSQAIDHLSSPQAKQRIEAAQYFGTHPEAVPAAVVPLCRATVDEEEEVGQWATSALEDCGPPPVEERDSLVQLLSDPHPDVVYWSITLLGRLEEQGRPASAAILPLVTGHASANVRQRGMWALGRFQEPSAAVRAALEDPIHQQDPRSRRVAERVLSDLFG